MIRTMKLSTNPAVWRVALGSVIAAGAQVGLLTPAIGDRLDGTVAGLASAATILLPIAAAWLSKTATLPVPAGSPPAQFYSRGAGGLYHPAGRPDVVDGIDREQYGYEPRGVND